MGLETGAIIAIGALAASTAAAGVANIASQKSANKTNVALQNESNALNYQMFQEQLGFTEKLQDKQNAYNTQAAQRQRYEQAGINPYLAMSNITSGNAELASTPSANPAVAPRVQPVTGLAQLLQNLGQVPSQVYQIQQMSQQVNAQREAIKAARIENLYRAADRSADINKKIAEQHKLLSDSSLNDDRRKEILANIDKLQFEKHSIDLQNQFYQRTLNARTRKEENMANLVYAQEQGQLLQNTYQSLTNAAFPKLTQAQLGLLSGQTYQAVMSGHMSASGAELNKAVTKRELTKLVGDVIDNGIKANQFKLSDFGLTSAELQAMRDGKIIENLNQSAISNWLDNIFYYTKTTMPNVPIGFIKGLK